MFLFSQEVAGAMVPPHDHAHPGITVIALEHIIEYIEKNLEDIHHDTHLDVRIHLISGF